MTKSRKIPERVRILVNLEDAVIAEGDEPAISIGEEFDLVIPTNGDAPEEIATALKFLLSRVLGQVVESSE